MNESAAFNWHAYGVKLQVHTAKLLFEVEERRQAVLIRLVTRVVREELEKAR